MRIPLIESEFEALESLARAKVAEIGNASIADGSNAGSSRSQVYRGHRSVQVQFTIWQLDGRSKMHLIEVHHGLNGPAAVVDVYWKDLSEVWLARKEEMGFNHLVVNHSWYRFNDPVFKDGVLQRGNGFGGRLIRFQRVKWIPEYGREGAYRALGEVEETRDLWFGGRIPPEFHDLLPDNAIFLDAFDGPVVMH